jgi:hypothetical protein
MQALAEPKGHFEVGYEVTITPINQPAAKPAI